MLRTQDRSKDSHQSLPPQKKVTFYGPVVTTRGEKLRPVRVDNNTRRQVLAPSSSLSSFNQTSWLSKKPKHMYSKSSGAEVLRPHSKISVLGNQLKTRLNCNHARPKCQCPNVSDDKDKQSKAKTRSIVSDVRGSSHILTSTRTVPRGGVNGRKSYASGDDKDAVSFMDANWRTNQLAFKETDKEETGKTHKTYDHSHSGNTMSKHTLEDNSKKRVQFSDETTSVINDDMQNHHSDINHDGLRKDDVLDNLGDGIESHFQPTSRSNSSPLPHGNVDNDYQTYDDYSEKDGDDYDSTSLSEMSEQVKEVHQETCKLCETPRFRHLSRSRQRRMNSSRDYVPSHLRKPTSNPFIPPFRQYNDDDVCALCRRFNHRSLSLDDGHCYHCDSSDLDSSDLVHCPKCTRIQREGHLKNRFPKKMSAPSFASEGEDEILQSDHIPYEPKTELVKDLKKKLEREYRHQDYLHHLVHHRRKWKSWDAEDLDELRRFRSHKVNRCRDWDYGLPHKCVHHYLQNDRLYLEPTITDKEGRSLCAECGAHEPIDPKDEPYLYHFTLGGLKKNDTKNVGSSGKENDRKYYQQPEKIEQSQKTPGDTSKHVFAKLNHSIDNIFPGRSRLYWRPAAADHLRYRIPLHSKRHPNKSMALVDHLV